MFIHSMKSHHLLLDNRGKMRMVFYLLLTTYFLFYFLKLAELKKGLRYSVLPWKCGLFKFKILVYIFFLCVIYVAGRCGGPPTSVEPFQGKEQQC